MLRCAAGVAVATKRDVIAALERIPAGATVCFQLQDDEAVRPPVEPWRPATGTAGAPPTTVHVEAPPCSSTFSCKHTARCVAAVGCADEAERSMFVAATCSLREENELYLLEHDEDAGKVCLLANPIDHPREGGFGHRRRRR